MNRPKRLRKWPWVLLFLAASGGAALAFQRSRAAPPPLDLALVVTAKRGPFSIDVVETGKVAPREKVDLKSKVSGQVTRVLVDEGEHVKKGQLLIVLDPIDYEREVARAAAEVAQARHGVEFAKLTLERKKTGQAAGVTTQLELEAAVAEVRAKELALRAVLVSLVTAQDRVSYTKIASTMDGTVIQRGIDPGEAVVPGVQSTFEGKALLTVADLSVLVVKIDLNQIDVAKVRLGQTADLKLDAIPGQTYPAKVTKIAPASVKPAGRDVEVFPVEAQIDAPDGRILPGMSADVIIHVEQKPDVVSLPIEAVVREDGKSWVKRVVEGTEPPTSTEKIEVVVGARSDRSVEIVSGLAEGARVLLSPASADANETKM